MTDHTGRLRVFTTEERALIRKTQAADCNDVEFEQFIYRCERTGLDPMARQIYCQVRKWGDDNRAFVVESNIDGFRLIAERSGKYAPGRDTVFTYDDKNKLVSATVYIKKRTDDGTWHEFGVQAFYSEYVQTKRDGTPNSMWTRMPRLMTAKCSEALGLRKGWPADLAGIYTTEEMGQAENQEAPPSTTTTTTPKADTPPPTKTDDPKPEPSKFEAAALAVLEAAKKLQLLTGEDIPDIIVSHSSFIDDVTKKPAVNSKGPKKGELIAFNDPIGYLRSRRDDAGKNKAYNWFNITTSKIHETIARMEPGAESVDEEGDKFVAETEGGDAAHQTPDAAADASEREPGAEG